jgi:hypothetical protein
MDTELRAYEPNQQDFILVRKSTVTDNLFCCLVDFEIPVVMLVYFSWLSPPHYLSFLQVAPLSQLFRSLQLFLGHSERDLCPVE